MGGVRGWEEAPPRKTFIERTESTLYRLTDSLLFASSFGLEGSRICRPKIFLFGIRIIIELNILRSCRHRRNSENRREVGL